MTSQSFRDADRRGEGRLSTRQAIAGGLISQTGHASVQWPSVARRHVFRRKVGVLVRDALVLEPRYQEARYQEARYLEGQERGYPGRGRHPRCLGPKPETTDRRTRSEVADTRIRPYRSSSTCPAGKAVVGVGRGRALVRRVESAARMPTRRQARRCVVATTSLDIFSRLPLRGHSKIRALSGGSNQQALKVSAW